MSTGSPPTESAHGYLSEESKRRFTLVAGILGGAFFLAQVLLPMLVIFLVMMPMMIGHEFRSADLDQAALWRDDLWFVERTERLNWRDPEKSAAGLTLHHVRVADLSDAGPALPLDAAATDSNPALLALGDRLWVIGPDTVSYYEGGSLASLRGARRPGRTSRPFAYGGSPAVISLGTSPALATLQVEGVRAEPLLLTVQMRRHRVQDYVFAGARRTFASLWQRALAQLVDVVPFVAALLLPMASMWRMFSDPEIFLESGPKFPFLIFGLFIGAFFWGLLILVAYSYLEGRFGKTPGKWLLGIRVLGTDLQPCGFGRAFLRNLLTFVDGFFNFLVGVLLVALTENWQRLGDLAARTVVVVDERPA